MQTLIDKNEALKKEINDLKDRIEVLKKSPIYRQQPQGGAKSKAKKTGVMGTLKGVVGLNTEQKEEMNPKQADSIAHVQGLLIKKAYDEVDVYVEQNKKLLFGKIKKGEKLPNVFSLVDEFGESVLMKAIKEGEIELALEWIEKGTVDSNVTDMYGETPLMVASQYGEEAIVATLVKKANRDAKTKFMKKTALHYAAEQGNLEVVKLLLENGCDCSIEDRSNRKAFAVAANEEVRDYIRQVMIKQGKAPTEEEEAVLKVTLEGQTQGGTKERDYSKDVEMKPLFEEQKQLQNIRRKLQLLFDDINKKRSPRDKLDQFLSMDEDERKKVLKLDGVDARIKKYHALIQRGMDDDAVDQVEVLLNEKRTEYIINKDAKDEFGETALMKAARLGFFEMLEMLLLYKCNTEIKDVEGYTALMKAAQFGKVDCVTKLIAEGADLNASSRKGKLTALMLAAERGHAEICELLIAEGADHSFVNSDGKQAIHLVKNANAKERIEKAIEEHPVTRPPVQI